MVVGDVRHRLHHGVAGAVLLGLQRPAHVAALEGLQHLLAAVAVDDVRGGGFEAGGGVEHVAEQRPAGERLQHLGQVGLHALALAGGQDHDGQGHGGIRFGGLPAFYPTGPLARPGCATAVRHDTGAAGGA